MKPPNRVHDRALLIRVGMLCLILASALHWFVPPASGLGRDLSDGVMGLLYGLFFGFSLRAVWLGRRRCSES